MKPLRRQLNLARLVGLLACSWSQTLHSQQPSSNTYVDSLYGYAFDYPSNYHVQAEGNLRFLTDGHLRTEVYVEDWTKSVLRGGGHWDFNSLVKERAATSCLADGPEGHMSCEVGEVQAVPNLHGIRFVVVTRKLFDSSADPDTGQTIDPFYAADLSGGGKYCLLVLASWPQRPGVPNDSILSVVATARRIAP